MGMRRSGRSATAIRKRCAVPGQQQIDTRTSHRLEKDAERAAAPETANVLPAELQADMAAEAAKSLDQTLLQQEQRESEAGDAVLPTQNLPGLLTYYRARIVALEDAAVSNAAVMERLSQKHAAAEKQWTQKTQDLQLQLKEQTERADALQSALQAKDSALTEQKARADARQAALEEAQAAQVDAALHATVAGHAELSDMEIMLRAIGIVQKTPSLKQGLLSAIGK